MIYISSNNAKHSVTKTFTPTFTTLQSTSLHLSTNASHLNFTQQHFTTLSFGFTPK